MTNGVATPVSTGVADSIFRLDFIVKFERDLGVDGDKIISTIVILFFLLSQNFFDVPCIILQSSCLVL